jgi:hypothetical protein
MQLAFCTALRDDELGSSKEANVELRRFKWLRCRQLALVGALLGAAVPLAAQQRADGVTTTDHAVELYLSEDALQAQYVRRLDLGDFGPTEMRAGFFYNEDRDLIGIGDLLAFVGDDVGVRSLELRVGTRVYGAFLAPEDQDIFGIGLGGEAQYFLGSSRNTSVTLALFYSPDIVTFGSADNVKDVSLRFSTRLRNGTDVFFGYRAFEIDLQPTDREVDDNLHVGIRRSF